jgi:hypothetical protein
LATACSNFKLVAMSDSVTTQFQQLLATPTLPALGPEARPGVLSVAALTAKWDALFSATRFSQPQQHLIRALLLLWHDHLDASHEISQGIENANGSFIHALMHRREPDYWNAKYWWRRVGDHPAFPEIARRVGDLANESRRRKEAEAEQLTAKLLPGGQWHASAFVDACEAAARSGQHVDLLREIQRIETEVLLEKILS